MKLVLIAVWILVSVSTFVIVVRDQIEFDLSWTLVLLVMSIGLGGSVVGLVYMLFG